MIRVHSANQGDINGMFEVDLRAYDYPIDYLTIKGHLTSGDFCVIAADALHHSVIGYAIFKPHRNEGYLEMVRLGVIPKRRQEGAGKELLRAGRDYAITTNLYEMSVVVPEVKCHPGDPDDVSLWLKYQGFSAVLPLLKGKFEMYGQHVDGIRFVRKVDVT